ncbi:response regulator [Ferrimonas sediminicola]|uniref:histidine kinase n=1 Tax=Ferrimonas sediminicola TaxID=2569538 RepID=A0A4U1BC85_9GAMM|nr:response regulator [Ferrimonas sediminicola]TKB48276.1 response regulator [Ferrimonas sediminicola]
MAGIWQKRYQRERAAREEVEALLENRNLELYQANQRLEAVNQRQAGEIRLRQRFDAYLLGVSRELLACSVAAPFDAIRECLNRLGLLLDAQWVGLEWGRGRILGWPSLYKGPWPKRQSGPLQPAEAMLRECGLGQGFQAVDTGVRLVVLFTREIHWQEAQQGLLRDLASLLNAFYDNWLAFSQLKRAEQEIHRMSTLRSRFLAMVTHQLRTPMNGVLGCADLLASTELTHEQRQLLRVLSQSGHGLLALLNDLLDYNKIDSDRFCLNDKATDLHQLCRDTLEIVRPMATAKGLELRYRIDGRLPESVRLDPGRYRQVLLNLLGNAINHTESGEVVLSLRSSPLRQGCQVTTAVVDSGPGISAGFMGQVFEPFSQQPGEGPATGLGLSISQKLVRCLGGELLVESHLGEGSRFHFTLELDGCQPLGHEREPVTPQKSGNILVAEDTKANQQAVRLMLERQGCRVTIVDNGREALQLACDHSFDLILMDCSMPEMDGYSATEALRRKGCSMPILALTATTTAEAHRMCLDAGMDAVLHKPIHREALINALNQWL